jgi:hypothetical protein
MAHSSLVTHDGSQVDRLLGVIFGEGLDLSAMASRTLPGQESEGAMARSFVLHKTLIPMFFPKYHYASTNLTVTVNKAISQ